MILRRIAEHLRSQQWTLIGIDFLIVVAGVFVGIQASNLNAERIDRRLEREYRERIIGDLDAILSNAANHRRFEISKTREIDAALRIATLPPSPDKARRLGHALTAVTTRLSPNFESPTFNDLQNSGRLALIDDPALRRDLANYFARLQYLRGALLRNNDNFAEPFVDFLRDENVRAGFVSSSKVEEVTMHELEQRIARMALQRLGPRRADPPGSPLFQPLSDPFWERLDSNLSWRSEGVAANENLLNLISAEARAMKREVERR